LNKEVKEKGDKLLALRRESGQLKKSQANLNKKVEEMKKPQAKPPTQPELTDFQKEYAAIQKRQKEKILILDAA